MRNLSIFLVAVVILFAGSVGVKALSTYLVTQGGTGRATFTASQLLYGNGTNALSSVATTSVTINAPLTTSGTAGALVGGTNLTIDIDDIKASDLDLTDITLADFTNDSGFLTTVDISANTNLTAGDGITLTNDDLDCDIASGSVFGCLASADWSVFNNKISSTTIDTEAELETFLTDVTNVFTNNDGALADDDLSNNSIEDLSDVATITENFGDLLYWNGSAWADIATSSLNLGTSALNLADITLADFTNDAGFITGNQTITLSGDVTGSGTTGITTTIANGAVDTYDLATTSAFADGEYVQWDSDGTFYGVTCAEITGSADLCDGVDGGGASPYDIATTSTIAVSQLAYFTKTGGLTTIGGVSTTTLTGGSQVAVSNSPVVLGSVGAVLSIVADSIGDTQLAFDTGQALTTASSPTFSGLTLSNDLTVGNGGTGASTFTDHGVLVGSGASAIDALVVGTNGQILVGSSGADPVFATLNCADALTCTTGAGTLEIDFDGGTAPGGSLGGTWASPTIDDLFILNTGDVGTGDYDFGGATSFELPNGTGLTTNASGEIAFDTDAWTRGALQVFDGTANTYVVGTLVSDTPANGEVPTFNTGGTITWETPTGGGGSGSTHWATTSPYSGKILQYPSDTGADLLIGGSATSTASFWFDEDNSTFYTGQYGAADSFLTFAGLGTATTTIGTDASNSYAFSISDSNTLGTTERLTILNGNVGISSSTPWAEFSVQADSYTNPIFSFATSSGGGYAGILNGWATSTTQTTVSSLNLPDTSGARVIIGSLLSYAQLAFNFTQLYIAGWFDQSDSQAFCDNPVGATALSADGANGYCTGFEFLEDGTGTFTATAGDGYTYGRLSATAANDGAGIFANGASAGWITIGTSTPIFAADARIASVNLATSTHAFYIGFTNLAVGGTAFETAPTQGCYLTASSTQANWQAISRNSAANVTQTNTGIASSTVTTGTGGWKRFYVVADEDNCQFFIQDGQANSMRLVADHSTNLPTASLNAGAYMADGTVGAGALFDLKRIRFWWREMLPAL